MNRNNDNYQNIISFEESLQICAKELKSIVCSAVHTFSKQIPYKKAEDYINTSGSVSNSDTDGHSGCFIEAYDEISPLLQKNEEKNNPFFNFLSPSTITDHQLQIENESGEESEKLRMMEETEEKMQWVSEELLGMRGMFEELEMIVHGQQSDINQIEEDVELAHVNAKYGERQLMSASGYARKVKCNRCFCLGLLVVVLMVVVVYFLVFYGIPNKWKLF